jgi:undecaprenyl-diphosphatase
MDILEALKYLFLGLVQGITEVLPISSSGHVELFRNIIHLDVDGSTLFLIIVNTGSLVTMIAIYFQRIVHLFLDSISYIFNKSSRDKTKAGFELTLKIIIATIPIAIVGVIFGDFLDSLLAKYNVLVSGVGLLFTGTVLIFVSTKKIRKGFTQITYLDAVLVGFAQAIALVPGISRSGMTTSTAINKGMGIDTALNFSFLLYIPASIGALLLNIKNFLSSGERVASSSVYFYYGIAFIAAIITTYLAYKIIFNIFKSGNIKYFGYYCLLLGFISMGYFILN